jgi:hypothetical protein
MSMKFDDFIASHRPQADDLASASREWVVG